MVYRRSTSGARVKHVAQFLFSEMDRDACTASNGCCVKLSRAVQRRLPEEELYKLEEGVVSWSNKAWADFLSKNNLDAVEFLGDEGYSCRRLEPSKETMVLEVNYHKKDNTNKLDRYIIDIRRDGGEALSREAPRRAGSRGFMSMAGRFIRRLSFPEP